MTQKETVRQYFLTHPNVEIPTAEVVDWAKQEYERVERKTFVTQIGKFAHSLARVFYKKYEKVSISTILMPLWITKT